MELIWNLLFVIWGLRLRAAKARPYMFNYFKKKPAPVPDKPKTLGQLGEEWAQEEYVRRGYKIIAKNEYHHKGKRLGEIDFIATKKPLLVFVEVKTRTVGVDTYGKGAESVNSSKQTKMLKTIKLYLLKHPKLAELRPQIDVCLIEAYSVDSQRYSVTILENSVEDWN